MTPLVVPVAVGVKVTAILQLAPAASDVTQAVAALKTPLLDVILLIVTAALLLLVTVMFLAALVVFTACEAKVVEAGEMSSVA